MLDGALDDIENLLVSVSFDSGLNEDGAVPIWLIRGKTGGAGNLLSEKVLRALLRVADPSCSGLRRFAAGTAPGTGSGGGNVFGMGRSELSSVVVVKSSFSFVLVMLRRGSGLREG